MRRPTIGVTIDNKDNTAGSGQYESAIRYSQAITQAGGLPVLLPQETALAADYVAHCDALVLTGGADPVMEQFSCATDHRARRIDAQRQAFELALLEEIDQYRDQAIAPHAWDKPVLGVCLGMQLMALHHGATLDQYMPDTLGDAQTRSHQDNARHHVLIEHHDSVLTRTPDPGHTQAGGDTPSTPAPPGPLTGQIISSHRQRIVDAGRMRVVARAEDGTVEAIDDPARRFYLGVQWHPERGNADDCPRLNADLFRSLVQHAAPADR